MAPSLSPECKTHHVDSGSLAAAFAREHGWAFICGPVLLADAEDERVVFVRHARVMRDALKAAGVRNIEYLELPYGGHSLDHQESRLAFFDAMEHFLITHLGH